MNGFYKQPKYAIIPDSFDAISVMGKTGRMAIMFCTQDASYSTDEHSAMDFALRLQLHSMYAKFVNELTLYLKMKDWSDDEMAAFLSGFVEFYELKTEECEEHGDPERTRFRHEIAAQLDEADARFQKRGL